MTTPQEMSEIRNKRMLAAFNLEKPDRIPIQLSGQMYFKWIDPAMVIADYWRRPKLVDEYLIQAARLPVIEEMDSAPSATGMSQDSFLKMFGSMWFAKMKVPGRELAEDALWQIDEQGPMTEEDYDTLIDKGWLALKQELWGRIDYDPSKLPPPDMEYMQEIQAKVAALGKVTLSMGGGFMPLPSFEVLSSARKLPSFLKDVRRMPEKVKAALEVMDQEEISVAEQSMKTAPGAYGFIGGTRAGSDFISPKTFEQLYFPFYQKMVSKMHENNVKTWFHNDGVWDGFLHYFTEFPKAQCIFDPDHLTDNYKLKEILGDRMCITGNVPPALTSVGTPEECYNYARELVNIFGDTGFIMNSGCTVPPNAKLENIKAVILATLGK